MPNLRKDKQEKKSKRKICWNHKNWWNCRIGFYKNRRKKIIIAIDYYSRKCWAKIINNRTTSTVIDFLEQNLRTLKIAKLVTDNAREFCFEKFKEYTSERKFKHHLTSIESHQSNGRCERIIRTIRELLLKTEREITKETLREVVIKYNGSYHTAIRKTPDEVFVNGLVVEKKEIEQYKQRFINNRHPKRFIIGEKVLTSKNENLNGKTEKGRFLEKGTIVGSFREEDAYLVKNDKTHKIQKRIYTDIKSIATPLWRGM